MTRDTLRVMPVLLTVSSTYCVLSVLMDLEAVGAESLMDRLPVLVPAGAVLLAMVLAPGVWARYYKWRDHQDVLHHAEDALDKWDT